MKVRIEHGRDDETRLAIAKFTRQGVTLDTEVEVVCQLYWPEDFSLDGDPFVLWPLSVTFTDTRQPATLTDGERAVVMEALVRRASAEMKDW